VNSGTGLALVVGAALALMGVRLFWRPMKALVGLALRVALGGVVLYAWDALARWPHLAVAVNPVTAGTVGLLGAPGFLLLLAVRSLL
jgi:inhibitor of the pro-sigma K processing machinery